MTGPCGESWTSYSFVIHGSRPETYRKHSSSHLAHQQWPFMDAIRRALKDMSMGSEKKVALVTGASGEPTPLLTTQSAVQSVPQE